MLLQFYWKPIDITDSLNRISITILIFLASESSKTPEAEMA